MQTPDSHSQKNSLFNAMSRFLVAIDNMDQTVMVPSLLRDVPLEDTVEDTVEDTGEDTGEDTAAAAFLQPDVDMYGSYVRLKSIRNHMEWGVLAVAGRPVDPVDMATGEDNDLEKQFHFHLKGLHSVLSKLTLKADTLTHRYKEEVGRRS